MLERLNEVRQLFFTEFSLGFQQLGLSRNHERHTIVGANKSVKHDADTDGARDIAAIFERVIDEASVQYPRLLTGRDFHELGGTDAVVEIEHGHPASALLELDLFQWAAAVLGPMPVRRRLAEQVLIAVDLDARVVSAAVLETSQSFELGRVGFIFFA